MAADSPRDLEPDQEQALTGSPSISLGAYSVKRGLAEELGAVDPTTGVFSLDRRDVGMDVTGGVGAISADQLPGSPTPLPPGHRFFHDCTREQHARFIEWAMVNGGVDSWFCTFTFKSYVSEGRAWRMFNDWTRRLQDAYQGKINALRSHGIRWVAAQEWQKRLVIHLHSIHSGVRLDELSRKRWEHRWSGMGGGYARIHPARLKAAPYLAKYVGKTDTQGGGLRRGGSWRGMTPPRALVCCQALMPG